VVAVGGGHGGRLGRYVQRFEQRGRRAVPGAVDVVERPEKVGSVSDRSQDRHADAFRDLFYAEVVAGVGHSDDEIALLDPEWQRLLSAGDFLRHEGYGFLGGLQHVEIGERHADLDRASLE
jgi:hypothetical protein